MARDQNHHTHTMRDFTASPTLSHAYFSQSQPKLGLGVRVKGLLKPLVFANEARARDCANVYPHTFL